MKIILNKYGESLELNIDLIYNSISFGEPPLVIGMHSCGGQMTLQGVASGWMALVCRSCNFRKLVPMNVCESNFTFARFFAEIIERTKGNLPSRGAGVRTR